MSTKRVWKELAFAKNDKCRDSESEMSDSRSSRSYRFNKVKFNKSRQDDQKSLKKMGLSGVTKLKDKSRQKSLTHQNITKNGDSSFLLKIDDPAQKQINLKSFQNRKIQLKMKNFFMDIHKIHDSFKQLAENMISNFEKIKSQLEANLITVIDQILKVGNNINSHKVIHQIIHNTFLQIKRNIARLPQYQKKLNNSNDDSFLFKSQLDNKVKKKYSFQMPSSPKLKSYPTQFLSKSRPKLYQNLAFKNSPQIMSIDQLNLELSVKSSQKQKIRTQIQMGEKYRISSFEKQLETKEEQIMSKKKNNDLSGAKAVTKVSDKATNIQNIISQMRSILNQ